jgi:hypothetical protein
VAESGVADKEKLGAGVAVPERLIDGDIPSKLSATVRVPVNMPGIIGANTTFALQEAPLARGDAESQLSDSVKLPVALTALIVIGPLAWLVIVTV